MSKIMEQEIINKAIDELSKKFDSIFIEGLSLKGHSFEKRIDLENFIKKNVVCVDDAMKQERIFYIKDEPFLLHSYKTEIEPILKNNNDSTLTATYGYFKYLTK